MQNSMLTCLLHSAKCVLLSLFVTGVTLSAQAQTDNQRTSHHTKSSSALNIPELGRGLSSWVDFESERQLGTAWLKTNQIRMPLLQDPVLFAQVDAWLAPFYSVIDIGPNPLRLVLVNQASLNAFAAPGPIMGLHLGLFNTMDTLDQVMSVVGHEFAHLEQRHYARQQASQAQDQWVTWLGAISGLALLAAGAGEAAQAALFGSGAYQMQKQLAYSRAYEQEADRVSLSYLNQLPQYQAKGMARAFAIMQQQSQIPASQWPVYLRTHPLSQSRLQDMQSRLYQLTPSPVDPDLANSQSDSFLMLRVYLAFVGPFYRSASSHRDLLQTLALLPWQKKQLALKKNVLELVSLLVEAKTKAVSDTKNAIDETFDNLLKQTSNNLFVIAWQRVEHISRDSQSGLGLHQAYQNKLPGLLWYWWQAQLHLQSGQPEKALQDLDTIKSLPSWFAISSWPDYWQEVAKAHAALKQNAWQHYALANAYVWRGQNTLAQEQLKLATQANQKQVDVILAAKLNALKRTFEALK